MKLRLFDTDRLIIVDSPIEWIRADEGQTFEPSNSDVIEQMIRTIETQTSYPCTAYMNHKDWSNVVKGNKRYFRTRRNLNRKPKTHFRK